MKILKSILLSMALALPISAGQYYNLKVNDSTTFQGAKVKTVDCDGRFDAQSNYQHHSLIDIDGYLYRNKMYDTVTANNGLQYYINNGDKFYTGINLDTIIEADKKPNPANILLKDNKGVDTIIGTNIIRFDTILDPEQQVKMWINNQELTMSKDSNYIVDGTNYKPSLLWGWQKNTTLLPQRYFVRLDTDIDTNNHKKFIIPILGSKMIRFDNDSCLVTTLSQPDQNTYVKMVFENNNKDTILACIGSQLRDFSDNFYGVVDTIRENGGKKFLQLQGVFMSRDGKKMFLNVNEGWKVGFGKDTAFVKFVDYNNGTMRFTNQQFNPVDYYSGKVGDVFTTKEGLEMKIEDSYMLKDKRIVVLKAVNFTPATTLVQRKIIPHRNIEKPKKYYDLLGRQIPNGKEISKKLKKIIISY